MYNNIQTILQRTELFDLMIPNQIIRIIWFGLCLNFVGCESCLESNSSDMLAVYETDLKDSIDWSSIFVRGYLSLIGKDTLLKCIAL